MTSHVITRFLLVLFICAVAPQLALAQNEPTPEQIEEARGYYEQAVQFYKNKEYIRAAEALEQAYALDPNPTLAYNIGKSFEDAGELERAKRWYRIALSYENLGDDEVRKAVKAIERIENIEANQPVEATESVLFLTSDPDGATVFLGDKEIGVTPLEHTLAEPGTYSLRFESDGYEAFTKEVDATRGGTVQIHAVLDSPSLMPWVYTAGGVAVLGLAGGITGDILAFEAEDDALANRDNDTVREDAKDRGKTMQAIAIAGYSLAGVAATTAVVLLVIELTGGRTDTEYETLGGFGFSPNGVSFTTRF